MTARPRIQINISRAMIWVVIVGLLLWEGGRLRHAVNAGAIGLGDYMGYWAAGRLLLQGANPYDAKELMRVEQSVGWNYPDPLVPFNPPWAMVVFLPLALLPFWLGRGLWFLLHLGLLVVTADWLWRSYGGRPSGRWIAWLAAVFFLPAGIALHLGQVSPLILVGVCAVAWALDSKRHLLAGGLTLLIALKPQLLALFWVLLLLWLIQQRRWDVAFSATATQVVAWAILHFLNPDVYLQYWVSLQSSSGPMAWLTPTWGVVIRLLSGNSSPWIQFLPTVLGMMAVLWLWGGWRSRFDWTGHLIPIVLASVITASYTWTGDWVILMPAVIAILVTAHCRNRRRWVLPLILLTFQGVLVLQALLKAANIYTVWMPPAIGLLYYLVRRGEGSQPLAARGESP